jgi:hypothetical protein
LLVNCLDELFAPKSQAFADAYAGYARVAVEVWRTTRIKLCQPLSRESVRMMLLGER